MAKTYTTVQGDTWDIISLKNYQSEKYVDILIDENYKHRERFIFPAGITLTIPDLPVSEQQSRNLPPWRRSR